jgi:hypothetical protein
MRVTIASAFTVLIVRRVHRTAAGKFTAHAQCILALSIRTIGGHRDPPQRDRNSPMSTFKGITVQPLSGALGAEIDGVCIADGIDDDAIAEVRQARLDHQVIFFRDQKLSDDTHKAFTARSGKIFVHPNYDLGQGGAEIVRLVRESSDSVAAGEEWHTDTTMVAQPPMGSILYALDVPPDGADTLFVNQFLAYEGVVRRHESDATHAQGRAQQNPGSGTTSGGELQAIKQSTRGRSLAADRECTPRCRDPSRNRPQVAVRQHRLNAAHGRHERQGKQALTGLPVHARQPS